MFPSSRHCSASTPSRKEVLLWAGSYEGGADCSELTEVGKLVRGAANSCGALSSGGDSLERRGELR